MQHKLYHGDDRFAWHARRWPEFHELENPLSAEIILPIYSMTEWGLGRPLDAEEVLGSYLLDAALKACPGTVDMLVLPPLRITPLQSASNTFTVDIELAHRMVIETIQSAAVAGYQRFVLYNTSPLLEEWIDVAARDLRVDHDLQVFCVNVAGVGLDFHPVRGGQRSGVQAILSLLLETPPEDSNLVLNDPIPNALVQMGQPAEFSDGAIDDFIKDRTEYLANLLAGVAAHPPLVNHVLNAEEGR